MGGGKSSARSGSAGLATPASCLLKSPHALRVPEYRLVLWVGSVPTPRVIMQAVFPWRQGTPCGDMIASGKFSQPERLQGQQLPAAFEGVRHLHAKACFEIHLPLGVIRVGCAFDFDMPLNGHVT